MALTPEFKNVVSKRNLLRIRIMLKDSLLVDRSFAQFGEMCQYAKMQGVDFWMSSREIERAPKEEWNRELMNLELTKLVNDFTKERVDYCQSLIKKVYGIKSTSASTQSRKREDALSKSVQSKRNEKSEDYKTIREDIYKMTEILHRCDQKRWTNKDVDDMQKYAKGIYKVCDNIKKRRR